MKNILLSTAVCSLLFVSCATVKKTATTACIKNNVTTYPTVADLDVQEKVTSSMSWNFAPFNWGEPKLSIAKGNLIAETLKQTNADVLLEPQFIFQRTSYRTRTLTVTGYPATYKNFRKATDKDLEAIKISVATKEEVHYNSTAGGLFGVLKVKK